MDSFNEYDQIGQEIMGWIDLVLQFIEIKYRFTFYLPKHDISRRFLNEIKEFYAEKEEE